MATLRALEPVLRVPGVMVVGSEVPNLLPPGAASTLVVSQDVDVCVPVEAHAAVRDQLDAVVGLAPSAEEPSVWVPLREGLIEAKFLGSEAGAARIGEAWVLEDDRLPRLVFGTLGVLDDGLESNVDGIVVPLPTATSLALEKLLTDRSGEKFDRDLLVVAGLLSAGGVDEDELVRRVGTLAPEHRWSVRANLAALSLLPDRAGMPPVGPHREVIARLVGRLEEP